MRSPLKTTGLLGGMSWESTATYYRLFNEGARKRFGGLHSAPLLLMSFDFAPIAALQGSGDWPRLSQQLCEGAKRLEGAGAAQILIATNTMHKIYDDVAAAVNVPVLHIVDATAQTMQAKAIKHPILLATRYTMEEDFYKGRLRDSFGIEAMTPDAEGRARVHQIIYDELCQGIIRPESKSAYLAEIAALTAKGADGVIFGCTEVGLLLKQSDLDRPAFDSTELHVAAALEAAAS